MLTTLFVFLGRSFEITTNIIVAEKSYSIIGKWEMICDLMILALPQNPWSSSVTIVDWFFYKWSQKVEYLQCTAMTLTPQRNVGSLVRDFCRQDTKWGQMILCYRHAILKWLPPDCDLKCAKRKEWMTFQSNTICICAFAPICTRGWLNGWWWRNWQKGINQEQITGCQRRTERPTLNLVESFWTCENSLLSFLAPFWNWAKDMKIMNLGRSIKNR